MPVNSFSNGIAQSQANSSQYANANNAIPTGQQPWNSMVFDPVATAQRTSGINAISGNTPTAGQQGEGGTWYDNGSGGAGVYRQQDATSQAHNAQTYYANQFRQNIPQTENTLYNQVGSTVNRNMNQGIKNTQQSNSNRGLLYGGINAGGEAGVRANASSNLASARSSINSGVENAANQMDQGAIDTGIAIQQQQQQMQNAIYSDAMAKMNNSNAGVGGLLGAVGMGVGMYMGAGTKTGAVAGGLLGSQAGKALG